MSDETEFNGSIFDLLVDMYTEAEVEHLTETGDEEQPALEPLWDKVMWGTVQVELAENIGRAHEIPGVVEVMAEKDVSSLLDKTRSRNCVVAAFAKSRVYHDGESLGLAKSVCEAMKE